MSGLKYAHDRHIFHADMKPENIFVSENGWLKLGDLGICKVVVTLAGKITGAQILGTIYYMPPECFQNKPASTAGDIWATGCILHWVVTGNTLFMEAPKEPRKVVQERIKNLVPCRLPKEYSRETRASICFMLQKNPALRPSAKEALDFLESIFDKSATVVEVVKPEEVGPGKKTMIFTQTGFMTFTAELNITGENKDQPEQVTSTAAAGVQSAYTQSSEDVKEHLRPSDPLKVCNLEVY